MNFSRARSSLSSLVLVLSLVAHGTAAASDTADEADLLFELGAEAYQLGNYREALRHFLASNRLVPNRNVTFNIARSYEKLGRYAEAHRYYVQALDVETNAAARRRIEQALEALAPNVAVLDVETNPPGATIYIDRRDLGPRGETPRVLGLPAGAFKVIVERAGYESSEVVVERIAQGERRKIAVQLKPILGVLEVDGESVRGASVRLDGADAEVACVAPCEVSVPPGQHVLHFQKPGYRAQETLVEVSPKTRMKVRPALEVIAGSVVVEADETGALVEVDGRPVGFTPALLRVPVGQHVVRVSSSGYSAIERGVEVREEEEVRIDVALARLEEVTAASRRKESVLDAPSSVSIIPAEELRLFAYPTIAEALRGLPGVYQWDDRAYPSLGFRGIGRLGSYGNRVLVLFDDHPANDNWVGSSYVSFDARTDLHDVERIEVVRGPGSVLYGTNAFAGVVNVVTRKPAAQHHTELGISATEDATGRVRVRQDVALGEHTGFWASAALGRGGGREFTFTDPASGDASVHAPADADRFSAGTVQGRFTHRWLTAQWFAHTHEKHQPTGWFETLVGDERARQRDTRGFVELRAEPQLTEKLHSTTRAHLNRYSYSADFPRAPEDGGVEVDTFQGGWAGIEQRFVYAATDALQLTAGAEGQYHFQANQFAEDSEGTFLADEHTLQVGAAYAMADLRLSQLRISAGARYDSYSTFGGSLNPRLAIVGRPYPGGNTKLIVGKAFRAPSIYELYYNDDGYTQVTPGSRGIELNPENVISAEIEHSHRLSPTVVATMGAFTTRTTSLITDAGEGTEDDPLYYINSSTPLATAGVELNVRREWRQGWMLESQYTFQRAEFLQDDGMAAWLSFDHATETRKVSNVPTHLFSLKGAMPIVGKALTLGSRFSVESSRFDRNELVDDPPQGETEAFAIWDVVIAGFEPRSGVRWNAGVYNAFDWRYAAPASAELSQASIAQRGRTFMADVLVGF